MSQTSFYLNNGIGNVGSYQISGSPWLSGSNLTASNANGGEVYFSFPRVSRSFTITNIGSIPLYIHFESRNNPNTLGHFHYSLLSNNSDSWTYGVRSTGFYVSCQGSTGTGSVSCAVELTGIDAREMFPLSGSGIND